MTNSNSKTPDVALFVTCLVDLIRPTVGFAAVKLLESAGCNVFVPIAQTCCGQPAYNSGDQRNTRELAKQVIETFEPFDYVVAPSGSCAGMIKEHYVGLFNDDPQMNQRAIQLAEKTFELVSFLSDVQGVSAVEAEFDGTVTYHDACAGLRELGIKDQPRALLRSVSGLTISEMQNSDVCCGFGGTFCVKYPDISNRIVEEKCADISSTNADTVLAGDLGCLLNIAGKLKRQGSTIQVRHVAEVIAGMTDTSAIGEPRE